MLSAFRSRLLRKSYYRSTRKLSVLPLELRCTPATINGQVFYDANANGAIDAGDNGLSGVTVFLDTNNNGVLDKTIKTYTSTNVPVTIPDKTTITSTLSVADTGTIADINVKLSITHTWDSDLDIFITSPTGTKIELSTDNGGNSPNYTNTVFDDEAATSVVGSAAPFTGSFKPEVALSGLDTQSITGTWTLTVTDDATNDTGTLTAWSIEITTGGETSQVTNATGNYSFTGLTAGSYNVAHVLPAGGYVQTTPGGDGRHHVTLAAPDTFVGNFGDRLPPATISGLVFNDVNGNGKNDSESPLSGVTVYLDLDNSGTFNAGDTSFVTAGDGKYTFGNLVPNKDYIVAEVLPGGFTHIAPIRNGLVASKNINVNKQSGDQSETSIAIDPGNPNRVFASSNQLGATGMMGSVSVDGGTTWTARNFGIGTDGYATSIGDPVHHFDKFGNLWGAQLASSGVATVVGRSTDGGKSFTTFYTTSASTDQPTIVTGNSSTPGRALVALVYNQSSSQLVSYLEVDAAGPIGTFSAPVTVPGSNSGIAGNFGDICIGPNGQVAVTYVHGGSGQGPDNVYFNLDVDGIGPSGFTARTTITSTNVGGFDFIPAQPDRSVDAEPDLVWDASGGPFHGRLYLTYTEETASENSNLDIMMRFSDNNGGSWSAAKRVNDDATTTSQFLPRSSIDQTNGHIAFSWYDARNDAANTLAEYWATVSFDGGATFQPNIKLSTGKSTAVSGNGNDYGDYSDVSFTNGRFIAIWADNSNSTGDNPGPNATSLDIYIAKVTVANNQQNYQITTSPGVTYGNNDFAIKGLVTSPNVTIDQAVGQADPTNGATINYTVVFSSSVADFATGDVTLSGTAGATTAIVTGGGTTYNVAVSGMTTSGTVIANLAAGVASSNNASTSTDNIVTFDNSSPTAGSSPASVTTFGGSTYTFTVTFADNTAINVSSLDNSDVRVTGPGGFDVPATFVGVDVNTNGTPRVATYSITPPGGTWDATDNGTYSVVVQSGQVLDTVGNATAIGTIASFNVNVATPAKITSTQINDGSAQRSRITSLTVTFDSVPGLPVNPADAFQLVRLSDSAVVDLVATPSGNTVTLTFAAGPAVDFTSLADGRYTLTALAAQINAGNFDGDDNGVVGDNYVLASAGTPNPPTNIFRFFGDSDGDGNVAANDFIQFRLGLGGTPAMFDFDNDGAVAASDFIQFRLRFGGSI